MRCALTTKSARNSRPSSESKLENEPETHPEATLPQREITKSENEPNNRIHAINLPAHFRSATERCFLFYGVALIAVMLLRPEGLLPSRIARRELHVDADNVSAGRRPRRCGGGLRNSGGGRLMRLLTAERVTKRFGGLVAVNALDFTLKEGFDRR